MNTFPAPTTHPDKSALARLLDEAHAHYVESAEERDGELFHILVSYGMSTKWTTRKEVTINLRMTYSVDVEVNEDDFDLDSFTEAVEAAVYDGFGGRFDPYDISGVDSFGHEQSIAEITSVKCQDVS